MYRKPKDGASAKVAVGGDGSSRQKTRVSKPKVALKRSSNAAAHGAITTEPSSASAAPASHHSGVATTPNVASNAAATRKRPSKLRASRERRQRDRSMSEDDLEHKFSNLSFSAPAFVPGASLAGNASLLNGRSLAFVTERSSVPPPAATLESTASPMANGFSIGVKRMPPPRRGQTPVASTSTSLNAAAPPFSGIGASLSAHEKQKPNAMGRPQVERRPRRQRIGAMGFSKGTISGPSTGAGRIRQGSAGATGGSAGASAAPGSANRSFSLKLNLSASSSATIPEADPDFQQRPRSDSAGSDSDYGSDDEVYPEGDQVSSAFPDRLTLFSQQKKIPKRVSRDVVIDTIFETLFTKKESESRQRGFSAFGDDTGTDNDDTPNEEFVKRGLAASLFKDHLGSSSGGIRFFSQRGNETQQQAVDRFITPALVHTLVTDMRFEDFRTASARIDILRAIHKNFPSKRIHIARALADATYLRLQYVTALLAKARALSIEKNQAIVDNKNDHGHGFTELLRYAIEHIGESLHGFPSSGGGQLGQAEVQEILRNYLLSLISLWRAHWLDSAGSDDEELISCAGQFVAYMPDVTVQLLQRLLANWPSKYPSQEVVAIRMVARVIMSSPPLHTMMNGPSANLHVKVFTRLARCVQSPHTQVAQEALAFTGCQFVMVHFLARYDDIYRVITEAFHANTVHHWNEAVRSTSEGHFDRALDYAS
uniref:Uncharacterized protein n=1 Tax=Globisporangium ultimum (strain ATCC 200006 / CBS 805.95 / DAOM BR144) TaxID=431595 RepID=K3WXG7_GLOUD